MCFKYNIFILGWTKWFRMNSYGFLLQQRKNMYSPIFNHEPYSELYWNSLNSFIHIFIKIKGTRPCVCFSVPVYMSLCISHCLSTLSNYTPTSFVNLYLSLKTLIIFSRYAGLLKSSWFLVCSEITLLRAYWAKLNIDQMEKGSTTKL